MTQQEAARHFGINSDDNGVTNTVSAFEISAKGYFDQKKKNISSIGNFKRLIDHMKSLRSISSTNQNAGYSRSHLFMVFSFLEMPNWKWQSLKRMTMELNSSVQLFQNWIRILRSVSLIKRQQNGCILKVIFSCTKQNNDLHCTICA